MAIVLICGSRGWSNSYPIHERVGQLPAGSVVIHGGAKGADELAGEAAKQHGLHSAIVRPLWDLFGKRAGHVRNLAMLDLAPDYVIAFNLGTPGTQDTIHEAKQRGISVEEITEATGEDSESCPTCGSDDPRVCGLSERLLGAMHEHEGGACCGDPFHYPSVPSARSLTPPTERGRRNG